MVLSASDLVGVVGAGPLSHGLAGVVGAGPLSHGLAGVVVEVFVDVDIAMLIV